MSRLCILGADCDRYQSATPGDTWGFNLCDTCHSHFTNDVASLLYTYVDLCQHIARRDGHSEAKIARPKPASTPPIDLNVYTLRSDITAAVFAAETDLRAVYAMPPREIDNVREGFNVQAAVMYVRPRVDQLAGLPGGPEHLLLLRSLRLKARKVMGLADLTIALPGFCPKCHVQGGLTRRDGTEAVVCGSCRHAMHWSDYQKLVTLVVTEIPSPTRNRET
jgi:hypothetical protein